MEYILIVIFSSIFVIFWMVNVIRAFLVAFDPKRNKDTKLGQIFFRLKNEEPEIYKKLGSPKTTVAQIMVFKEIEKSVLFEQIKSDELKALIIERNGVEIPKKTVLKIIAVWLAVLILGF